MKARASTADEHPLPSILTEDQCNGIEKYPSRSTIIYLVSVKE